MMSSHKQLTRLFLVVMAIGCLSAIKAAGRTNGQEKPTRLVGGSSSSDCPENTTLATGCDMHCGYTIGFTSGDCSYKKPKCLCNYGYCIAGDIYPNTKLCQLRDTMIECDIIEGCKVIPFKPKYPPPEPALPDDGKLRAMIAYADEQNDEVDPLDFGQADAEDME